MCWLTGRYANPLLLLVCCVTTGGVNAEAASTEQSQSINLELTTHLGDDQRFRHGDRIQFLLSLDAAAYVLLLYQDVEGNLIQLLPNRKDPDHHFEAGSFVSFPKPTASVEFVVQPPYGRETVWAFASDRPVPTLPGEPLSNGLRLLDLSIEQVRDWIRHSSNSLFDDARVRLHTRAN